MKNSLKEMKRVTHTKMENIITMSLFSYSRYEKSYIFLSNEFHKVFIYPTENCVPKFCFPFFFSYLILRKEIFLLNPILMFIDAKVHNFSPTDFTLKLQIMEEIL